MIKRKRCKKCGVLLFGNGRHYCSEDLHSSPESNFNNAVIDTAVDVLLGGIFSSSDSDSSGSSFDSGGGDFGGGGSSGDW